MFGGKATTFRPKKSFARGTRLHQLHKTAKLTLHATGDLAAAVRLPDGEDRNEWLAVNTVDLFNQINIAYGSVAEVCTPQACPVMCAGDAVEYLWADERARRPVKMSAPEYVAHLVEWVQRVIDDERVFPTSSAVQFPADFGATIKSICRRLFRVYAHIYHSHLAHVASAGDGAEAQLHTSFKHFYLFCREFALIDKRELLPLADLIQHLCGDVIQP